MDRPVLAKGTLRGSAAGVLARAVGWGIVRTLIGVVAAGILVCYAVA